MVSIALRVSEEFKAMTDKLPWVNWSELAREELIKRMERDKKFERFNKLLKDSKLTDELALELANELKKKVAKKHRL